jgi:carboxymethylenebutenolidase
MRSEHASASACGYRVRMCFDADSRPPRPPISGAAVDGRRLVLTSDDGTSFSAYQADASSPSGAGMIVLPDVRGLFPYYEELALRFAEADVDALAIDYFGRTAGPTERGGGFAHMPHVEQTTWAGLRADVATAAAHLRATRAVKALFSVGFCFGGRLSFLVATRPELAMAGVIGFYGWPVGRTRNDMPAPADEAARFAAPVLGIFGGADQNIPAEDVERFEQALVAAGVEHRVVSYGGAPHSFFDRKQEEHAEDSARAWHEMLTFIARHQTRS